MFTSAHPTCDWSSLVRRISCAVDLEATARRFGALQRARKLRSGEALLRLALLYGPAGLSLRAAAAAACEAGLAEDLSDKAVLGRLRRMGDWLEHILECLLGQVGPALGGQLAIVDGSLVFAPGAAGAGWRVHARYEPALGRFTDFALTTDRVAESVSRTRIGPKRTMVFDRGYARVRDIAAVLAAGSDVVTRIGWRSLRLRDAQGQRIDLLALLPAGSGVVEHEVWLQGIARPLRLVLQRLPPGQAETQAKRTRRRASKRCQKLDPRTLAANGCMMLLTTLPGGQVPPAQVVKLYQARWQVELGFKRMKSLGGLDRLPASDPALARSWLLAQLIAAVLTEDLVGRIAGFSPQGGGAWQQGGCAVAVA
jgi:hypothetical protein